MPFINLNDTDDDTSEFRRRGKKKTYPMHLIRSEAREDAKAGYGASFRCPECSISYHERFGKWAKKGPFGEATLYCLDCFKRSDIHAAR